MHRHVFSLQLSPFRVLCAVPTHNLHHVERLPPIHLWLIATPPPPSLPPPAAARAPPLLLVTPWRFRSILSSSSPPHRLNYGHIDGCGGPSPPQTSPPLHLSPSPPPSGSLRPRLRASPSALLGWSVAHSARSEPQRPSALRQSLHIWSLAATPAHTIHHHLSLLLFLRCVPALVAVCCFLRWVPLCVPVCCLSLCLLLRRPVLLLRWLVLRVAASCCCLCMRRRQDHIMASWPPSRGC